MGKRRVVVTGLGAVSPIGTDVAQSWANALNGVSGIARITKFDASILPTQIAGEVKGFDINQYMTPKEARHFDTFIHFGIAASLQAFADSGLEITPENAEQVGCIVSSGIGGLPLIENTHTDLVERGVKRVTPFFVPGSIINMISGQLSIMKGLKGPNLSVVTACTTGLHSIGEASRIIEYGDADVMLAGGAESTVSPLGVGGFCAARALSTRNDDPATASRPWDKDRDGFVLGEGAGVLVLEELEHAQKRGAKIYAELIGYGRSGDASHITAPNTDGPKRSMVNALKNAQLNVDQIQLINAHGTSTPLGDKNETDAIKLTFGESAKNLVVNSTKSMTVYHQKITPTINIFNQDPECDLDYCANVARDARIDFALKNNFGFGGTNGSLIFARFS
jgi:3-oxoacyl-[acyl-carrier-protein] synthase II